MATIDSGVTTAAPWQYSTRAVAQFSDGTFFVVYYDGTNTVYRTSSDGTTWSAKTTVTTGLSSAAAYIALDRSGDTLYGAVCSTSALVPIKVAYSGGSVTVSTGTALSVNIGNGNTAALSCAYDSANTWFHLAIAGYNGGAQIYLYAYNTALTQQYSYTGTTLGTGGYDVALVVAGSTLWVSEDGNVSGVTIGASAYTVPAWTTVHQFATSGSGITSGLDPASGTNRPFFVASDSSYNALSYYSYDGTSWSQANIGSIGANTGAVATVKGSGSTSELWVFYSLTATQANGEVYLVKGTGSPRSWGTPTLVEGGDATGHTLPSAPLQQSTGSIPLAWRDGTASPYGLVDTTYALGGGDPFPAGYGYPGRLGADAVYRM